MITLGIETSGRAGSVALVIDGEVREERELSATGRRHARTLIPEMGTMLSSAGLKPGEIDVVAVSLGPGSFTGLRVGVVCAKTFAYATGGRIVGIDTFLAVANAHETGPSLWVIDDALRDDVCAGEYAYKDGAWRCIREPRLLSFADWREAISRHSVASGPGVEKFSERLAETTLAPVELRVPQARHVALLGEARAVRGDVDDAWTLEPFYMRRSAAEEKADAINA